MKALIIKNWVIVTFVLAWIADHQMQILPRITEDVFYQDVIKGLGAIAMLFINKFKNSYTNDSRS